MVRPGTLGHIGQVVGGRYELLTLLSEGGMGSVFKARHTQLERPFALKLVHPHLLSGKLAGERFLREARLASSLNHQNIVAVTDFGHDPQHGYFLVMELLAGETLRDLMGRQQVGVRVALDIVDQLSGVVRHIHKSGILHCDLKPENMFLSRPEGEARRRNHLKLLDFGLSWRRDALAETEICGTPPYLAPERLRGEPPSGQCDVYSLGMILYELIAGRPAFSGDPVEIMKQQLLGMPPPPYQDDNPELRIDSQVNGLIMRAISLDPAGRHPTADAFHYELRAVMDMTGIRSRSVTRPVGIARTAAPAARPDDDVLSALTESPFPMALFEPNGTVRFASRAFVHLAGGTKEGARTLADLPALASSAEITDAFGLAVETRRTLSRRVMVGDRELALLVAPVLRGVEVDVLHVLLLRG